MSNVAIKRKQRKNGRKNNNAREVSKFAGDAYSLAERAYKGVSHVLKLINIETKFLDYIVLSGSMPSATGVYYLSGLAQGLDISNRVGDSIKLQGIHIGFQMGISNATTVGVARIIIFRDLENQGVAPVWADVMSSTGYPYEIAPVNYLNRNRFSILFDESTAIQPIAYTGTMKEASIPHTGHIKYRGITSAVGSAAEGSVFALVWAASMSAQPSFGLVVRFLYTDD
jgi:hypothetical protein